MINICHQYRSINQSSLFYKELRIIYRGETPSFHENDGNSESQEPTPEELVNTQVQKTLEYQRQSIQTVQNSPLLSPQEKEGHAKETAQLNKDIIGPDNTLYLQNTIIFPGLREIYGFHLEFHVSQENIQTYQSLDIKVSLLIQDQKFDEAIGATKDFIEQNPKFPAKNILEISLVEAVLQKIESIQEGNSLWSEGGLKKFLDKHFDFINQRLANLTLKPNGKETVTFYLESLYQSGRIDRQHPLFHKLLLISPEFEEKENNKFHLHIQKLNEDIHNISQQLSNPNLSQVNIRDLLMQRKTLSAEIMSRHMQRHSLASTPFLKQVVRSQGMLFSK